MAARSVERRTRASTRRHEPLPTSSKDPSSSPKWDAASVDSGFCSDVERRVANLTFELEKDLEPTMERRRRARKYSFEDVSTNEDYRRMTSHDMVRRSHERHASHESTRKSRTLPSALSHREHSQKNNEINIKDLSLRDLNHVRVLGRGGYARVDLVNLKHDTSKIFALKKMNKSLIEERCQIDHVVAEKEVMLISKSRFIPRLYRTFHSPHHIFMLSEACMGGDLFSVLEKCGRLQTSSLQYVVACVVEALDYLHNSLNVLHRDVKTENVLLDHNGTAKLADLGFCKRLHIRGERSYTFCGTPGYVAPEILLRNGHDKSCDFFSLGVVAFESGTCRSPFRRQTPIDTHRATLRGIKEVPFPSYFDGNIVDLITRMCCSDTRSRLGSAEQIRKHPWFKSMDWNKLKCGKLPSPLLNTVTSSKTSTSVSKETNYADDEITPTNYEYKWDENF